MVHVVDVSNEEVEEVDHPNVGDDDLIDDIDNYSSKNDGAFLSANNINPKFL